MTKKWLSKYFKPDLIAEDVLDIAYDQLFADGIRLLLVDIDNTLSEHGARKANEYAQKAIAKMQAAGLSVHLMSNARRERAISFARSLDIAVTGMAYKPSPAALLEASGKLALKENQVCMIGDQLLTDVLAAKRAGVMSILVRPVAPRESLHIKFKRFIERLILARICDTTCHTSPDRIK